MKHLFTCTLLFVGLCLAHAQTVVSITDLGAKGDGKTINTQAFQQAIDKVNGAGGGRVVVPAGVFKTGTLFLKSNVELFLSPGSTLLGSDKLSDYTPHHAPQPLKTLESSDIKYALVVAIAQENIRIAGSGTIDGNGKAKAFANKGSNTCDRPFTVRMLHCRQVYVGGIRMVNSPMWMQHYVQCDHLTLENLYVFNHANWNNDGIDIDQCQQVVVRGCFIDADDDGLCFKGSGYRTSKNITVSDCVIRSNCNVLKFGTHSMSGLQNMTVTNCVLMGSRVKSEVWARSMALAAIAIESVDGGHISDITISNCVTDSCYAPFFIRLGERLRKVQDSDTPRVGSIKNIQFSNIKAKNTRIEPSIITGLPGHRVENVRFDGVEFEVFGQGKAEWLNPDVPEHPAKYPEIVMFGKAVPASAMYIRHAKEIKFNQCSFRFQHPDPRPPLYHEDVQGLQLNGVDYK